MALEAPLGVKPERISASDSIKEWVATFLQYFELKLRLLGIESKEAGMHLVVLLLLVVSTVACFTGFLLLLAVFMLYLVGRLLMLDWGWSALVIAVLLLIGSVVSAVVLRLRIARPIFAHTLAEIRKDHEWLRHRKKKSV